MLNWLRSLFGSKQEGPAVSLESLQGSWQMVSCGKDGNFAPPQMLAQAKIVMTIKGDQYTVSSRGKVGDIGQIQLDTSQTPVHFDQQIKSGSDAGKFHLGIVRFRDGLLENCQGDMGRPRPKDFAEKRTDGASLVCFRKQS